PAAPRRLSTLSRGGRVALAHATPVTTPTQLRAAGGSESRSPAGAVASLPSRIVGHITLGLTACPGNAMIPLIPQITAAVQKRIKAFAKPRRKKKGHKKRRGGVGAQAR